jgi:hypothetical protein
MVFNGKFVEAICLKAMDFSLQQKKKKTKRHPREKMSFV